MIIGLTKRIRVPEEISLSQAMELKLKMQERVMELWNLHQ